MKNRPSLSQSCVKWKALETGSIFKRKKKKKEKGKKRRREKVGSLAATNERRGYIREIIFGRKDFVLRVKDFADELTAIFFPLPPFSFPFSSYTNIFTRPLDFFFSSFSFFLFFFYRRLTSRPTVTATILRHDGSMDRSPARLRNEKPQDF